MEVCSRHMAIIWGQPAAPLPSHEEDEIISSSSSINHIIKERGAKPIISSLSSSDFSAKHKGRDHDKQSRSNIVDNTDGHVEYRDADVDGEEQQHQQELSMEAMRECSMCGHVGLPQYLFKCLSCSHRFQHIYCSNLYPYRVEAAICNWCLPMKPEIAVEEEDDDDNQHTVNRKIAINSEYSKPQQVKQIKKHSKAFEYLLQIIADLADESCHKLNEAVDDDRQIKQYCRSGDNDVGHDQITKMCTSQEAGFNHMSWKHKNSYVNHQLEENNMIREVLAEGKSFHAGTEAQSFNGAFSHARALLKRPRCHVDDSRKPMKAAIDWQGYDQIIRNCRDHYKIRDSNVGYDQDLWIQNNCLIDDDEKADAKAANSQKRLLSTLTKQSMGMASGANGISKPKAANQQETFSLLQAASAAKTGFSNGGGDDDGHVTLRNKQPVATSTWPVQSTKPVVGAGKRDHLSNSPSRAFNRRYKLLADVLC
ncbi:hypothetical protein GOP47_0016560 [Adiantum capillus-veneris]|uniref:PHD-type zinc finger plants domain-containing protein n=1 Tax=Adiantum capillus-veneris TaxID=13818 RepID=A0A9D4ZC71_ADICA|nr:hypothetical protein GOP47_0016560 [Adiantum capillus-veneris]